MIQAQNVLSDKQYQHEKFLFDLQLFGKGGGGKSRGKLLFGVAGFFLGGGFWTTLGASSWLGGAVMGASLFSSIWMATHKPKTPSNNGSDVTIQRFDKAQETMSSTASIPIVYGERKISGNQTYHNVNADLTQLHKHVVLCEGGIEGISSVTANGLLIPTGVQNSNTVFTIRNNKYEDAYVELKDKTLTLFANGTKKDIFLKNKDDMQSEGSYEFWEYQVNISSLVSYINQRYRDGWECFPTASTNKYPGDLKIGLSRIKAATKTLDTMAFIAEGFTPADAAKLPSMPNGAEFTNKYGSIYVFTGKTTTRKSGSQDIIFYEFEQYTTSYNRNCYQKQVNFETPTVTGGTTYTFHDSETPETYSETGGYPQMAWLDMKFFSSQELNGNPNVEVVVKGKKVYDPRNGRYGYSTNPALCTLDFLTSHRYGLGRWISHDDLDMDSFKTAANYCDHVIDFEDSFGNKIKAKRYELNMVIDQRQDAITWLQNILGNFCGFLVYSQGKLKLMIERETPVSYAFTDDDILDMSISQIELDSCPNEYDVTIVDPRNNWKSIKAKCIDHADIKTRGRIVKKEVELEGVTSQYQALRLARFYRDYNLTCSLQISFTTGMQGMHLECGDVVTITYRGVFKGLPIRIMEIRETEENQYEISGRQYNESIYSDDLGGGVQWHNYYSGKEMGNRFKTAVPDKIRDVVAYTNVDDEILIEHSPSEDPEFKEYRYYVEEVNDHA